MLAKKSYISKVLVSLLFALLLWSGGKVAAQTPLGFRIPDASITEKDTFTITIDADSVLTGREVYSYRFYITYNPSYFEFLGVDGIGSVLTAWGAPTVNSSNAGTIIMAGAGSSPLTGSGGMIDLKFVSKTNGGSYISFNTTESYLNERNPLSVYENGYISIAQRSYPNIYPDNSNLFIGDEVQMSVSGGEAPYTYSVENTGVAVITEQTKVQAVAAGTTKVLVTDNNGEVSYTTGVFDIRSIRMDIEEVSAWPADTFYIPVKIEVAPGTSVYSGIIDITYDTGLSGLTNDIVTGDYSATFQSNADAGTISLSFASSSPITGNGILCYLGFRANSSGNMWIHFNDMHFNEELLAWTTQSTYYINISSLPSLTISPNYGKLLWGDMIQVTASGGTAPYDYASSDNSVATVDAQGNIDALSGGEITITATDAHGATKTSDIFTVNDCNVTVNNTDGVLDVDTRVPITVSQLPSGRKIYGFKASFDFDDANLDFVRVDAYSSVLLEGTLSGNTISVAGASGSGISSGVIGYLVFRIKNSLSLNSTASVTFNSFSANENTIFASLIAGSVRRVDQVSYRPVANAGQNFSVLEGESAQLDGSASYDNDDDPLTYKWIAPAGVMLDYATTDTARFTAPQVDEDTPYIFKLVVNDGTDDSDTATVTVTVLQLNQMPTADAGLDESYIEGSSVSLDGSNSFDPDNDPLSFNWTSLDGIVLFNSTGVKPSFILPQVTQNSTYRFKLVVNDGVVNSSADTVVITGLQVNKKPVAFAGGDFSVNEGEPAALDGSLSYDDDHDAITYQWSALSNVTLSSVTVAQPTFTAPAVHRDSVLVFTLVVNDGTKDSDPDEVLVTVVNVDILSTEALIDSVMLQDLESFTIDAGSNEIILNMPYGYDVRSMNPQFKISEQASINPLSGSAHDFSMPVYYSVTAEDGTTVRTWKVVVNSPVNSVERMLSAGWNWVSLNVKPADMTVTTLFNGLFLQDLDYVKSTEYSATYYSSTGWFGDLESFPENRTVRFKKGTSAILNVTGTEINPEITPISLVPGWNSIAYLLNKNVGINDAMKSSTIPTGNVVMKGVDGSSVYFAGTGWSGEIDSMRVLSGYKINVEHSGALLYDASGVTKSTSMSRYSREQLLEMYSLNTAAFSYSSTLIAEVSSVSGGEFIQPGDLLVAYHGNECRGVSEAKYIAGLGRYVFVLTYYSNSDSEDIQFRVKPNDRENELSTDYSVVFRSDVISGEAAMPVPLLVDGATAISDDVNLNSLAIYPNPVSDLLNVSASQIISRVAVYNSVGSKVIELLPDSKSVSVQVQKLAKGVYNVQVEINNEITNRKVVKTSK